MDIKSQPETVTQRIDRIKEIIARLSLYDIAKFQEEVLSGFTSQEQLALVLCFSGDIKWLIEENRNLAKLFMEAKSISEINVKDIVSVWDKVIGSTKIGANTEVNGVMIIDKKDIHDWGRRLLRVAVEEITKNINKHNKNV